MGAEKIIDNKNTVITDIRFKNEVEFFRNKGFIIIRMVSSVEDRQKRYINLYNKEITKEQMNNISEVTLDSYNNWDYIVDNNETIGDLKNKVNTLLIEIGNKFKLKTK